MPDTAAKRAGKDDIHSVLPLENGTPKFTLLPIAEPPFILGCPAAVTIWSAALSLSQSLYS